MKLRKKFDTTGNYIFTPSVFRHLEDEIAGNYDGTEIDLTVAMDEVRVEEGFSAFLINGKRYDIGRPESYAVTITQLYEDSKAEMKKHHKPLL